MTCPELDASCKPRLLEPEKAAMVFTLVMLGGSSHLALLLRLQKVVGVRGAGIHESCLCRGSVFSQPC